MLASRHTFLLLLLLFTFLSTLVSGAKQQLTRYSTDDAPTVNAGIATTMTSKFLQEYRRDVMDLFVSRMNEFHIADANPDYNLGVGKVYLALTN